MMQAVLELLMDALRRRLVMVLLLLSALIIGGIGYGLQLEVVDGAIASAKVFGQIVSQSEEGSLNLTGIMTGVRTMWFILITLVCLILSAGTITDWMKDSYSIFLLQSGLSRAQVYLGILTATWLLLGAFIALTTFSLELLLETKLKVEFAGIRQAGLGLVASSFQPLGNVVCRTSSANSVAGRHAYRFNFSRCWLRATRCPTQRASVIHDPFIAHAFGQRMDLLATS